jgi:signal transduction histidine kinase
VDLHAVGAARVTGDQELLTRLVRNLAENAEQHASSTVTFEVHKRGTLAELVVADDGPGIPNDKREWVFERFARLDEGRGRRSGGTGLGLAIVGEIARAHNGTVRIVESRGGARMQVLLPADGPDKTTRIETPTQASAGIRRDVPARRSVSVE